MRRLVELLDHLRNHGYLVATPKGGGRMKFEIQKPNDLEVELFAKVEPFVFSDGDTVPDMNADVIGLTAEGWNGGGLDNNNDLDAPFPVFSIECLEGPLDSYVLQNKSERGHTLCVIVIELYPKQYGYYTYTESFDIVTGETLGFAAWKSNVEGKTVKHYLDRLAREHTGVQAVRTMVKIGEGKQKRMHRIRRVVHVRPRRESTAGDGGGKIDWTHRFEVRGHWREHTGKLGKDREGNYCIPDWTWVVNHVKGPDHLPLIKKTRVVE